MYYGIVEPLPIMMGNVPEIKLVMVSEGEAPNIMDETTS